MSNRKILMWAAGAILLYIAYKLFFGEKSAGEKTVASGRGDVGQSDFQPANTPTTSNVVDLPYGPAPEDAVPPDGLFGPTLPDGSFYRTT